MAFDTEARRPLRQQLRLQGGVDVVSSSSNITLDRKSGNFQAINPTASIGVILPPEEYSEGLVFWIQNTGTTGFPIVVFTDTPAVLMSLPPRGGAALVCDGTSWIIQQQTNTLGGVNVETLTGNKTLTTGDAEYQQLDPGGASRNVTLPSASTMEGRSFQISNFADAAEDLDVGIGIATLNQSEAVRVVSDGLFWKHMGIYTIALT